MSDSQEKKEKLKTRIQVAKDKLEEYKRRGMADIIIRVKEENIDKEVKIETLGKKLDEIKKSVEELPDEDIVNFDETELEIKEAIIKELGKTLPCKPLVPRINISIKKKRWCWKNKGGVKDCVSIVSLVLSIGCNILVVIFHDRCIFFNYFLALLGGVLLSSFGLPFLINIYLNEDLSRKMKWAVVFFVNLLFSMTPVVLVYNFNENLSKSFCVQVLTLISFILLLIIICRFTKIENGIENRYNISLLKASNMFLFFFLTAIKLLFKEKSFLIDYYYLLPLMGLRGLYELFEEKIKRNAKKEACHE